MRHFAQTLPVAVLAVVALLAVACGQSASTAGSARAIATAAGAGADMGPEVAFAPKGSLLYVRTAGAGPAWNALSRVRARVAGLKDVGPTDAIGNFLRLATAADFAAGSTAMLNSLTGESAEVLISNRAVAGEDGSPAADSFFYSRVAHHAALETWIKSHSSYLGADGGYTLYAGKSRYSGYSALSQTVWLEGGSLSALRESIATAAGTHPSLLDDPSFRSAAAALDDHGAALVAYSRGDLATELGQIWLGQAVTQNALFPGLTAGLGLADTALAVGANRHGVWMRAAPRVLARGYRPGATFTPSLVHQVPAGSIVYAGVENGGSQLAQFDRVLDPLLGDGDSVAKAIADVFHVTSSDLAAIGAGEQAWVIGPETGVAFRPTDPARAASVLAAEAARNTAVGVTSGRHGDIVWIHNHPTMPARPLTGASPATLVARAGLPHRVSWVLAVNLTFLDDLLGDQSSSTPATPLASVSGVVVSSSPAAAGRYGLDLFLDIG
jgi:hypothetical protein